MELKPRKVVITGAGVISALGDSPAALHAALCAGQSGLSPVSLFSTEGLGCPVGGEVRDFNARHYLGERNLRPLNRIAQLVAAAAQQALAASGWTAEMRTARELGLVLGTMFCSAHTISEFDRRALTMGPGFASPMDFANTVINAAAGQTAILHNLRGINSTIATGATSGLQAISYAADLIRQGRANALLAGGADEMCFESFFGCYRAGLLCGSASQWKSNGHHNGHRDGGHNHQVSEGDYPIPFDERRNGFALGEGAALLVLEDAESAALRGAPILAEVKGYGSTYDYSRAWDTEHAVAAIRRAMRLALDDARLVPDEIDCLSASANGSSASDRHEALALAATFGHREERLPLTAIKSLLGETLGAAGALQTISLMETLRDHILPGIARLERTDRDFPLHAVSIGRQEVPVRDGLINAIGFDGHSCSLVIGNYSNH
jgi:3-oxoacyl-[acyl-carrier-protein] synthase II